MTTSRPQRRTSTDQCPHPGCVKKKKLLNLLIQRDGVAENTRQETQLCLEPLEGVLESFREFRRPHILFSAGGINCARELREAALWG